MKTKKPRSAKAVKPAARAVRRATQKKTRTPRLKATPARAKRAKSKNPRKAVTPTRRRPKAAAKTKRVRKRVARKPRTKLSPLLVEDEQLELPAVAGLEPEPGLAAPESAGSGPRIPEILLEEDETAPPPMTGPGQKYALGPKPPAGQAGPEEAALPAAYGTGKLTLAALDPHCLYAQWDLTPQQQRRYNAQSADRHLVVRVYRGTVSGRLAAEVHVHPESRHWFVHVARAEARYLAQLGYYRPRRQWVTVATSGPARTPPDSIAAEQTVRFATIPTHVRLTKLVALAKQSIPTDLPPTEAARERALAELLTLHAGEIEAASSAEAGELARPPGQEVSAAQAGPEVEHVSSPTGPVEQAPAGFWFNVNAELVIYGATEPDATVTIGGRPIQLRPDGTFSCRLSLPDGEHSVTVSAMSAGGELRQAELRFSRRTDYRGEAGAAPPDLGL